ncbi:MAG: hypothetical protein V4576_04285 [Patescibacteria group bacterium]
MGKIIAIVLFVFMILLIVNYKSVLPYFSSAALGGNTQSPFQIGASYVDQADKMSPYGSALGGGQTTYAEFKAAQQGKTVTGSKITQPVVKGGKVTVEKRGNFLYMTTEYLQVPKQNPKVHIWVTNRPTITSDTSYLDFGVMRGGESLQTYNLDVGDPNVSLEEYKYVMVIDPVNFTIYGQSVLGK